MRTERLVVLGLACTLLTPAVACGHGSLAVPVSRVYNGFLQGPESPPSAAVQAAIAIGGTQPFYDWHELVNFAPGTPAYQANVPYHERIPDGELASGGNFKYRGLDLVRDDWPSTPINAGPFDFVWTAPTPHDPSVFHAWITVSTWNPSQPLTWAALEPLPLGAITPADHAYHFSTVLPPRTGKHCIYVIWQRIDPVGEGFYSVSDVDFGDGGGSACPADLTGDGAVDGADLGALLSAWGNASADLNGDGTTNGADLGDLLGAWGPCGPDCDRDGVSDADALAAGADDCDMNLVPDACDFASGGDADGNGVLDACQIDGLTYAWSVSDQWGSGFVAALRVTNAGSQTVHGWQLQFTTPGYTIVNAWNGVLMAQSGGEVTVANAAWNGHVPPGGSFTIGYEAAGTPAAPTSVRLNGNTAAPE